MKGVGSDATAGPAPAHPDTVAQTVGQAVFPVVRSLSKRGKGGELPDGRQVMFDDDTSPTNAYLRAAGISRSTLRDVQFNHVWPTSDERDGYTALWNVCMTPAFLAKTTDGSNHPEVVAVLRYRAHAHYGALPHVLPAPVKPTDFDSVEWAPFPPAVSDLETVLRDRLRRSPKSVASVGARTIGWVHSGWVPDPRI